MPVVYVTQPGALLRKKSGRLQVQWNRQVLSSLPLRTAERLVLLGPVQLSAACIRTLLKARTPVVFCSQRGTWYGQLSAGCEDVELLLAQVARYHDPTYRLGIARAIVDAKICHQQRLFQRYARNHPDAALNDTVAKLGALRSTLRRRDSVAEVMGVEGQASALYFSVFGRCLRQPGLTFSQRTRRPPRDPVNAVLSLGYMLVLGEVLTAVAAQGMHPGVGFLHEISSRHPALALDMLELARQPIADRLALSLFNRRVLEGGDFVTRPDGATQLNEAGLKRYLAYYERVMTTRFRDGPGAPVTLRDWVRSCVEGLRAAVTEGRLWTPPVLEL